MVWMLCGAFAFATMGAFTYALGPRCDWLLIALVRAVFMFGFACAMARARGIRLAVWEPRTLWVRSIAGSFSLVCNFYALTRLPVADVLTLTNTYPLWIILATAVILNIPPTWLEVFGVVCGLTGVVLIERPHHVDGDSLAVAVSLLASVSTAVAMLGLHRLKHIQAPAIVAHFAGVASLVAGAWLVLRGGGLGPRAGEPLTWLLLLGVAASGTAGQFFLTKAYAEGMPTEVSVVALTQVLFALGFDVALWGRTLTGWTLLGFVFVLGPTALLTSRAGRRLAETAGPPARPEPVGRAVSLSSSD
jgi:drug/metabolite transporter (DMT)-like permease